MCSCSSFMENIGTKKLLQEHIIDQASGLPLQQGVVFLSADGTRSPGPKNEFKWAMMNGYAYPQQYISYTVRDNPTITPRLVLTMSSPPQINSSSPELIPEFSSGFRHMD